MFTCFFASDLHGHTDRYEKLLERIRAEQPRAVLLGGDLLPNHLALRASNFGRADFIGGFLAPAFRRLADDLGPSAPRVLLILGNDDPRLAEASVLGAAAAGVWEYVHERTVELERWTVTGYACVPPTPFLLKDWERYDVSRSVDPGAVSPEAGRRTVPVPERETRWSTIAKDLARLAGDADQAQAIWLFHTPPYDTKLDRAALDGKMVDRVPLDVHVGSMAVRRFIEARGPRVTLHGHVHESARLTGAWREHIGRTEALSAAHDGPELALVRFDPGDPAAATRELI
ncbi:MAG: metallophosphoesterase [Candidatus Krumholzibacteriota bacterium]|nr:metallophosphoesterase [Candidatus Krumholzibacteriota bacterium]